MTHERATTSSLPEHPFVSVCIPARNGARELPYTLTNLLTHTTYRRDRIEVVIGDHGSLDNTREVLSRWPEVRRVDVEYRGANRAQVRNRILGEARGDIILFLDHDILVSDECVATHVRLHRQFPGALLAGQTYGKDILRPQTDAFLARLNLSHIQDSASLLRETAAMADARLDRELLGQRTEEPCDAGAELAPWRFFWTCNLSARAADIRECGGFDEVYEGWGVEDDDFALQFRNHGKRLLFSREAWAFHVPHAVDAGKNLMSWRRNVRIMFCKHPTREFEYFLLYGREVLPGSNRFERALRRLAEVDGDAAEAEAAQVLGQPRGRRLVFLAHGVASARRLSATDVLFPHGPLSGAPWTQDGARFWSVVGIHTPFGDGEIEEAVLLLDTLVLLERHLLLWLLSEVTRVSQRVSFVFGPASRSSRYAPGVQTVREAADLFRLREVAWLDAAKP